MSALLGEGLSFRWGDAWVVREVSVSVSPGEVVGILGPNGGGKTTLMRLLAGQLSPQQGGVKLLDKPLLDHTPRQRAKRLAYLPQNAACHEPLRVREVVALGRFPHLGLWGRMAAEDASAIEGAMEEVGVSHLADIRVDRLSGGEKARVMLGRALAVRAPVLLADEPIAGLDPHYQLGAMQVLRRRAAANGAVLVALHDLVLASRFCHRLILLNEGRSLRQGTPREVLSPEGLALAFGVSGKYIEAESSLLVLPWEHLPKSS